MQVGISGAGGLIGRALADAIEESGGRVVRLVRRETDAADERAWVHPAQPPPLGDLDAVVHLAGEPVADGRWSAERKRRIRDSRVGRTAALAAAMATDGPRVLVCASAIGIYGDRGDEVVDEDSAPGAGFLAEVCEAWEAATAPLAEAGGRVVNARIGVVLDPGGGALAKLLPVFKWGVGGPVGRGDQWMSWISLPDVVGALRLALTEDWMRGPVNLVAPHPITSRMFAKALGGALKRPAFMPAPAWALKAVFGEMARETVLAGQRVRPTRLLDGGFVFAQPTVEQALHHALGR